MHTAKRILTLLLATMFLVGALRPIMALDPTRALTQCVHRIWQVQQGLPEGTVTCVLQTRDRYLYLGTRSGLVRFDGVQFLPLRVVDGVSLEKVWIHDLHEDAEHNLWIATDRAGLIRWREDGAQQYGVADGLPSANVQCVRSDPSGNLWIATDAGLARWKDGQLESIHDERGPLRELKAICVTGDGKVLTGGSGNQLWTIENGRVTSSAIDALPSTTTINALLCARDGTVWIGSDDGLVQYGPDKQRRFTVADGLSNNLIYCLTEGAEGSLFIGTNDGFDRYRDGEFESFRTRDGLSQSTVYSICEDHEGGLWVGTKLGLNQFFDRRTIPFTTAEGLPSNATGPVIQNEAGTIWVGTLDAGLARYDGRHFSTITSKDHLPSDTILSLATGAGQELWVGTDRGLCRLEGDKVVETWTTREGLPSDRIRSLCRDSQGVLWVGTSAGLIARRNRAFVRPTADESYVKQAIVVLLAEADGSLLVATEEQGLYRCRENRLTRYELLAPTPSHIAALYRDPEGRICVSTRGDGLYILNGGQTRQLSVQTGLSDDEIFGITDDDHGSLWMACSKGIISMARADFQAFADGKVKSITTSPLSPLDSLRTVECQSGVQPGIMKTRDGKVWFSTIRGALVVDPTRWQRTLPPTTVVVESATINGKSESPLQPLTAGPGVVNLHFRYTALSFTSPSRITFQYLLEGFDSTWVDAGTRREAFYTNLPPGSYRFRVMAKNVDGKLYETALPVELRISPRLYQTVWFLPACGIAILLAGWGAYRLRVRRVRQQMNAVVAERSRIARELHDTLIQGFSGITMEMQALASRLPDSAERNSLDEIIDDAGACLREARRSVAGLRSDLSGLVAAIKQTAHQLTETQNVRLKLQMDAIPQRLSPETEYNLLRIAQEAISNAVKHSGGHSISVSLESKGQELHLRIQDDGAGFTLPPSDLAGFGHYGLIGMRERASQIGADFSLESRPGQGTTVRVVLSPHPSPVESVV